MKRFLLVLMMLLLLAGCGRENIQPSQDATLPTASTQPTEPTEPPVPWVEETGMEWDAEGVLKEIPLTIPDGLHFSSAMEFDGDLLLWSIDDHRVQSVLELCLVELDDGSIAATAEIPVGRYIYPQCLGDTLYICDGPTGKITGLNKALETEQQWEIEKTEDSLIMGGNGIAYRTTMDEQVQSNHLLAVDLNTGESVPAMEGDPDIGWVSENGDTLSIRCYLPDTGAPDYAVLDLNTGAYAYAGAQRNVDSAYRVDGVWVLEYYGESYSYDLYPAGGEPFRISPENATLKLLPEGHILKTALDSTTLSLHNTDGTLISACRLSEQENGYVDSTVIWNEALGGYFILHRNYGDTARLLFWDVEKSTEVPNLTLEAVPTPAESQLRLEQRAAELGKKYGISILVGEQCETSFDEFTATQATDYEQVSQALNILDKALAVYPEGFLRQLRYDTVYGVSIQLIQDLQANGSGRYGGGYAAFTQSRWEDALMVVDIEAASVDTYYHEFSHIIDKYLEWDATMRTDAIYSEAGWVDLNPGWFDGYTYDYSWTQELSADGAFIDGYATISPTEDRARVMEYAMANWSSGYFQPGTVLARKLDYYCDCIRDAFDTTGWTETPLWEQYV